jgi:hypothetical protein
VSSFILLGLVVGHIRYLNISNLGESGHMELKLHVVCFFFEKIKNDVWKFQTNSGPKFLR